MRKFASHATAVPGRAIRCCAVPGLQHNTAIRCCAVPWLQHNTAIRHCAVPGLQHNTAIRRCAVPGLQHNTAIRRCAVPWLQHNTAIRHCAVPGLHHRTAIRRCAVPGLHQRTAIRRCAVTGLEHNAAIRVVVVAPIGNSDHSSLSAVISLAHAVANLCVGRKVLLKHHVNWNTVCGAIQDLPRCNIWLSDNPVEVLNEHLTLLVGRYVPSYQARSSVCGTRITWFGDQCRRAFGLKHEAHLWWTRDRSQLIGKSVRCQVRAN